MIPEARGSRTLGAKDPGKDIILWEGVSCTFMRALDELLRERVVVLKPVSALLYFAEGAALPYEVPEGPEDFSGTRWVPVVLCRPGPNASREAGR